MNAEDQRALIREHLERREDIRAQAQESLEARKKLAEDPLVDVDPEIRVAVEDEFYKELGRQRYETSDGRMLFLSLKDIEHREKARKKRERQRRRRTYSYYGPASDSNKLWIWGFNVGTVVLALLLVYLILWR